MKIFYGGAIQGNTDRQQRAHVHQTYTSTLSNNGYHVLTEHTKGQNRAETTALLEEKFGPLPPDGIARRRFVRDKMIESVESDICAAVFEVSVPSLGTGVEIAHAYLRPRMGLTTIPVITLYEKDHWPNQLSTMIQGLPPTEFPNVYQIEYESLTNGQQQLLATLENALKP